MPMVSWRRSQENTTTDFHPLTVHRASPQAAWMGQSAADGLQAPLATLLAMKPGSTKGSPAVQSHSQEKSSRTPERVSRSQPASPARTRRTSNDKAQQYVVSDSAGTAASGISSYSSNSQSSTRNQPGFWSRTYGRPSSNPAPSRPAAGHLASPTGAGRAVTPGRTAVAAWGYSSNAQQPQLNDFFTAQALKVPQRLAHSPYLSGNKTAQSGGTVLQHSSPYSPKGRSSNSITQQQQSSSLQQWQEQQKQIDEGATIDGNGRLLSPPSPDLLAKAKLGYVFSFNKSTASSSTKPAAAGSLNTSAEGSLRPSRGPGSLGSLSPHSPAAASNPASSPIVTARSSAFRTSRYTGAAVAGPASSSSPSSGRQRTPAGSSSSPSTSSSASSLAFSAHKQSLRQHQQQHQMQKQQQQPVLQQQQLHQQQQAIHQQHSTEQNASLEHSQQQSSGQVMNASGQLSGISILGPSSSSLAGRPVTAKGSSRAELRCELTPAASAGGPGISSSNINLSQLGGNLDTQSWSTFLAVGASASGSNATNAMPGGSNRMPSAGKEHMVSANPIQHPGSASLSRSLQSQMLADLGLNGNASAPQKQPSGVSVSHSGGISSNGVAPANHHNSSSIGSVLWSGSGAAAKSILQSAADALAVASTNPAAVAVVRHSVDAEARADSSHGSGSAVISGAVDTPPEDGASAAVAGPLHAGLLRPKSGHHQHILQPVQQQHQQPQSFLQQLQQQQLQQQQQHQQQPATVSVSGQVTTATQQQQAYPGSPPATAAAAARFVQTPSGGIRRRSGNGSGTVTASPGGRSSTEWGSAGGSISSSAQEKQQQRSNACAGADAASPGTPSRDHKALTPATAGAAAALPNASSPQWDSPLKRPSDLGVNHSSTASPINRLQGEWGTLTALRGSAGWGAAGLESSTELSTDCNSNGSWGSGGGAAAVATMGGAATAAAVGGSALAGPGPSPLSVSSTAGGSQVASVAAGYAAGGGMGVAAAAGARRALNFGDSGAPRSSADTAAGASAEAADNAPLQHRLSNMSSTTMYTQQRSPLATSRDGSVVSSQPAASAASVRASVQAPQQQQCPRQQQQQQPQQQAPTPPTAAPVAPTASPQAAIRTAAQPEPAAPVRPASRTSSGVGAASGVETAIRQAAPAVQAQSQPQWQQPGPQQPQAQAKQQQQQQPSKQARKATASDCGDDYDSQAISTGPAPAAAAAAPPATTAAAPAAAVAASTTPAPADADDSSDSMLLPGYSVGRVVGEGGFCQVRLATHHLSRRKVAVKVIDKTKLSDHNEASRIQREIRVLKRLNHAAIIRLFEVLEAGSKLFLVMEYAPAGSLLDYVRSRKRLSEGESAYFLQQIVAGLQYCHDNEVVHRDIKLENILLDATNNMKLIDFGLAAFYAPGKKLRVHCGSPSYAAPEIVARKLYEGPPVDVWSLGVVLFAMMAGFLPFHSPTGNKQELCQKIMAGTYNPPDWLSPAAKDLLARMLTVDPERRITLAEVAAHPFTKGSGPSWEMPAANCYSMPAVVQGANGAEEIAADPAILAELESHAYPRITTLRYLAAGETNYVTASYYLLAEAKAEAARKLLPAKPWPFQPVVIHGSSRSGSSRASQRAPASSAGSTTSSRPGTTSGQAAAYGGGAAAENAAMNNTAVTVP